MQGTSPTGHGQYLGPLRQLRLLENYFLLIVPSSSPVPMLHYRAIVSAAF